MCTLTTNRWKLNHYVCIGADLIRVSCGIEGTQDLINDFDQALAKIGS